MSSRFVSQRRPVCMLIACLLLVLGGWAWTPQGPVPASERLVAVISLDGFPADALDNPNVPIPTLQRLIREGAAAARMSVSNPSVTWPNHTTMVTGVTPALHGVLFNGMLIREGPGKPVRVEPWRDKSEMVRVPTLYDLAFQAGLKTAQADWVAIQNPGTISWEFPEVPKIEGALERELVAEGMLTVEEITGFRQHHIAWRDLQWTRAARHVLSRHRPNLLLLHLLTLDSIHHGYGPGSSPSYPTFGYLDGLVAQVIETAEAAGFLGKMTVFVVSDHGFKAYEKRIQPNVLLLRKGLIRKDGQQVHADVHVVPEGGTAMVYVTDPTRRSELMPQLVEWFSELEGVDRVLQPEDFPGLGLPKPSENDQMADLLLSARDGYTFGGSLDGDMIEAARGGSHGYLSSDRDMDGLFLAWGYGIRPGARVERVSNLDLAPTAAALLGLKLPRTEGRVLQEILKDAVGSK